MVLLFPATFVQPLPLRARLFDRQACVSPSRSSLPPRRLKYRAVEARMVSRQTTEAPMRPDSMSGEKLTDFAAGFVSVTEMPDETEMQVLGKIPHFLHGTLYRIGPGIWNIAHADGKLAEKTHWFDGTGVVFKFTLDSRKNTARYMCKVICPEEVRAIQSTTKSEYKGFTFGAQKDGRSFLEKLYRLFRPFTKDPKTGNLPMNINVTLERIPGQGELVARSDFNYNLLLDPDTLEVTGKFDFTRIHPSFRGINAAGHGAVDEHTGEVFNFCSGDWRQIGMYRVFCIKPNGDAELLAEIQGNIACQVHSMSLTPNFVVIAISPWRVNVFKILFQSSLAPSLDFDEKQKTTFYVISRHLKKVVAEYEANPFCAFHYINAFEDPKPGVDALHIDVCKYESADIIDQFYLSNLRTKSAEWFSEVHPVRFTLSGVRRVANKATLSLASRSLVHKGIAKEYMLSDCRLELPCIAPRYTGKPYRYSYGVSHDRTHDEILANCLVKLDWETGRSVVWRLPRSCIGEPTFVENPNASSEDDGVLMVMVVNAELKTSFLKILDARTMTELCSIQTPQTVPHGFHGMFVPRDN